MEDGSQPPGAATAPERVYSGLTLNPFRGAKRTIVILSLALASCRGPLPPASPTPEVVSLRILADSATSPLLRDLASHYAPANVLITWDVQVGDASTALNWIKQGQAAYALLDYVPSAEFDSRWWTTPVGQDGIAVVVHPSNPIANLTAAQFRAVLQGRILNWAELGGTNMPLNVVARNDTSSDAAIIQSIALGDRRVTRSARLATTSQAVVDIVSADPGAIGYASMGYLNSSIRAVPLDGILPTSDTVTANQYPLRAPIVFVGLHEPGNDGYRAFFAWTQSPEGQAIVRQHYGGLVR